MAGSVRIPVWGLYMMLAGSAIGTLLLFAELHRRGWPPLLTKG